MITRLLAILLVGIGAISCQNPNSDGSPADLEKQKLANQIRRKVATKLKEEIGLIPCGTIGQMLNKVQVLGLSFDYYQPTDIAEGRKLLIKAINSLMDEVNQEKRIHPYLSRYPFAPRNIEVEIFIRSPEGGDVPPGAIWVVDASEGFLRYDIHHPTKSGFITIYKETYEEALERIKDPSLPNVSFQPSPEISEAELARLGKGICFLSSDGAIWHLGDDGSWIKDPKSPQ
jgi:hypothetical protein